MTLQEIKQAVKNGKKVYWSSPLYEVKHRINFMDEEEWYIKCNSNGHIIGLTWLDGTTLNGKEQDFFTEDI